MEAPEPGRQLTPTPAAKLPSLAHAAGTQQEHRQPGHWAPALGQAACACIKQTKTRFEIAPQITNFTSGSTQLQVFLREARQEKIRLN